jgi:hypothetical protein
LFFFSSLGTHKKHTTTNARRGGKIPEKKVLFFSLQKEKTENFNKPGGRGGTKRKQKFFRGVV